MKKSLALLILLALLLSACAPCWSFWNVTECDINQAGYRAATQTAQARYEIGATALAEQFIKLTPQP